MRSWPTSIGSLGVPKLFLSRTLALYCFAETDNRVDDLTDLETSSLQ